HRKPFFIDRKGFFRVDEDVAVSILRMRFFDRYLLMPAVHSADWIRMHRKGDVLMYTAIRPKNARRVGIVAFVGADSLYNAHFPFARFNFVDGHLIRRPPVAFCVLVTPPAADVM